MTETAPEKAQIWIDADACPKPIRELLFRAANRTQTHITFIANQLIPVPPSQFIRSVQVEKGFDIADDEIVRRCQDGDLVITQDIPLASEVIDKGCLVINTRGEKLSKANVKARLNMRDFLETMRSSGVQTGGPPPLSKTERMAFANQLDRWLASLPTTGNSRP